MHHLLEHINQDKKGDKEKIRTKQYIKLNIFQHPVQFTIIKYTLKYESWVVVKVLKCKALENYLHRYTICNFPNYLEV